MSSEPQASALGRRKRARAFYDPRPAITRRLVGRIAYGRLIVTTPGGERIVGEGEPGGEAILHLHDWRALWRVLAASDVGFAEAVIAGEASSPDLVALIRLLDRNVDALGGAATTFGPARWLAKIAHNARANSRAGSARNIMAHYDLGNAFFAAWLDPSMSYSSAIYSDENETLEIAQARKVERILDLLRLSGDERALEVGCGWGALAARLAEAGVSALDALTISPAQAERARERLAGQEQAKVLLKDYRDIDTAYDRIVSIEMCEAVGEVYLPLYFETLARALKSGGRAVLQVITIAERRLADYRTHPDFIQRHVFPGGFLPSRTLLIETAARAGLKLASDETFGLSYALTLAEWRRRFHAQWARIATLGFDARFRRLWDYYLCYCEAGFREGTVDVGLYAFEPI